MIANKNEWFSLKWEPKDFYNEKSFEQLKECPRFLFANNDSICIESYALNKFSLLRITSINLVTYFIEKNGVKLPTHYIKDEFLPGDNPKYDEWLKEYHDLTLELNDQMRDKALIQQKNIYLEHAAKIIRHDMHSGINTYIPRGLNGLLRKLPEDIISKYKLETPIKLLKEGLEHTQKVYQGVYAFTNLVKKDSCLNLEKCDLKIILQDFLKGTAYEDQVIINDLCEAEVNPSLFCTAIDNLIRNGLKYNDSYTKWIKIFIENDKELCIVDNGRGMSQEEFNIYCRPYTRKENQVESGSGLGLNIANSILQEHNFIMLVEKLDEGGTKLKVRLK